MNHDLQRYLNDHLAGSAGAVDLIQSLSDACESPEVKQEFDQLRLEVEEDRKILEELLSKIGYRRSELLQAAGSLTFQASKLKLHWEGLKPGCLGWLEALEMLCLGIQGKRLLWVALSRLQSSLPQWESYDFEGLQSRAVRQSEIAELHRLRAAMDSLLNERPEDENQLDERRFTFAD